MTDQEKLKYLIVMLRWYINYHDEDFLLANYGEEAANEDRVTANFMKGWLKHIGEIA